MKTAQAQGLKVPDAFFDPLPDTLVDVFYDDVAPRTPSRVAEGSARFSKRVPRRQRQRRG